MQAYQLITMVVRPRSREVARGMLNLIQCKEGALRVEGPGAAEDIIKLVRQVADA